MGNTLTKTESLLRSESGVTFTRRRIIAVSRNKNQMSARAKRQARNNGIPFELAVARVQRMMDTTSTVEHNIKLLDKNGLARQFDVVVRGSFGGLKAIGVIECRDHSKRLGLDDVEAFASKSRSVHANTAVIVSRRGFTSSALILAKDLGIGTMSLVEAESPFTPLQLRNPWYGISHEFDQLVFHFEYLGPGPAAVGCPLDQPFFNKMPVCNYVSRRLMDNFDELPTGAFKYQIRFHEPLPVLVSNHSLLLIGVSAEGIRLRRTKVAWHPIKCDGYFDWQESSIKVAPSSPVSVQINSFDTESWEDFEGVIPPESPYTFLVHSRRSLIPDDEPVPDLSSLCCVNELVKG